jgi:hypothetical protein
MMQRGGQVVIHLIANVQQKTIEPLIKDTIVPGTRVYTDDTAFMPACVAGDTAIRVSTMGEASLPATTMATAFAKCTSTRWKVLGLSCEVGFAHIGVLHKRNSRSTWDSSSLCTTSASEAKRCFLRSLHYWSRKTLESNMSDGHMHHGKQHHPGHAGRRQFVQCCEPYRSADEKWGLSHKSTRTTGVP